jgi:hypothetical protein
VDISAEKTLPAITVLNKYFNNAITFIHSDSLSALTRINTTFDFFHIDGHHDNNYITNEFVLIQKLNNRSDKVLRVMFDDQDSMIPLQHNIQQRFYIIKKIIPKCAWCNVYFEIQM